jgi:hypothetical protein
MEEKEKLDTEFGNEPSRTVTLLKFGGIILKTESCEVVPCELPTAEWLSIPLEIPAETGKYFSAFSSSSSPKSELLHLPVYTGEEALDAHAFEELARNAKSTGHEVKIPIVTITTKVCGHIDEDRAIKSFGILPIWKDKTSILLELDWHEGNAAEGSINPECFVRATPKLPVEDGFQKLGDSSSIHPNAENCTYNLYVNPASLGKHALGEGKEYPSQLWQREWTFNNRDEMLTAIARLSKEIASAHW